MWKPRTQQPPGVLGLFTIEIEQERVGNSVMFMRVGGEIAKIDLVHYFVVKEEVEQRAQHQHKGAAVSGGSGEVGAGLDDRAVAELDIHEERNGDRDAVHHLRDQQRVPVLLHRVEELGAVNGIAKLNVVPGAISRAARSSAIPG